MFYTYLARCIDQSLYTGITNNIENREIKHNTGNGGSYTSKKFPLKIVYFETFSTRSEAAKREQQIKGWTRIKKENLIKYGHPNPFKNKPKKHT